MAAADRGRPATESPVPTDGAAVEAFLESDDATPKRLKTFLDALRGTAICPWCLAPLRPLPDAADPLDDAGAAEWLPETVIDGV